MSTSNDNEPDGVDESNDPFAQHFQVDPTPDSPDEEANTEALQGMLRSYQQALEQEWEEEKKYEEGDLTPSQIRNKTKELLTQAVPKAVASLLYLAQHASNEQVKMKAATYIIDKAIGTEKGLVGDPMEQLLADLQDSKAT